MNFTLILASKCAEMNSLNAGHNERIFYMGIYTQVNRMCRSRRVLATGGKQTILGLDMVCIETILFHLDTL